MTTLHRWASQQWHPIIRTNMNDELRTKLWDFCYGLLDEGEAVEVREQITSDPEVAREYSRVKLETELVAQAATASTMWERPADAFKVATAERKLSARTRSWARMGVTIVTAAVAASLLLAVGIVYWSPDSPVRSPLLAHSYDRIATENTRMIVTGTAKIRPEEQSNYFVQLQRFDHEPVRAVVEAKLKDANGNGLWSESRETDAEGVLNLQIPAEIDKQSNYFFEITAHSKIGDEVTERKPVAEMKTWLALAEPPPAKVVREYYRASNRSIVRVVEVGAADRPQELERLKEMPKPDPTKDNAPPELPSEEKAPAGGELVAQENNFGAVRLGISDKSYSESEEITSKRLSDSKQNLAEESRPLNRDDSPSTFNVPAPVVTPTTPLPAEPSDRPVSPNGTTVAGVEFKEQHGDHVNEAKKGKKSNLLVEAIRGIDGEIDSSRVVSLDDARQEDGLSELAGTIAPTGSIDSLSSSKELWDFTTAPPQRVSGTTILASQTRAAQEIDRLSVEVKFDAKGYRPNDQATARISVKDAQGQPIAAMLGVAVETVPTDEVSLEGLNSESDFDSLTAADELSLAQASNQPMPPPLLFDNGSHQETSYRTAMDAWMTQRTAQRDSSAAMLLIGSGVGYSLLLIAALVKWLPKAKVWAPLAGMLALSFITGVSWLAFSDSPVSVPSISSQFTYGITESRPALAMSMPATPTPTTSDYAAPVDLYSYQEVLEQRTKTDATPTVQYDNGRNLWYDTDGAVPLPVTTHWSLAATPGSSGGVGSGGVGGGGFALPADDLAKHGGNDLRFSRYYFRVPTLQPLSLSVLEETKLAERNSPQEISSATRETLYLHPLIATNDQGEAAVEFIVPELPRAYSLTVNAHSRGHYGRTTTLVPVVVRARPVVEKEN